MPAIVETTAMPAESNSENVNSPHPRSETEIAPQKLGQDRVSPSLPAGRTFIPASAILEELRKAAPADHFTIDWLMGRLDKQSFGLLILLLAILAIAPGICSVAGPLLMIAAFQMTLGRPAPSFPHWIAVRPLPTRHLGSVVTHAIRALRFLEKMIRPRWPTPIEATKRVVGIAVMILSARLTLVPIPLSNIVPALVIALISLGYVEEDGLVLLIALLAGLLVLAIDAGALWDIVRAA